MLERVTTYAAVSAETLAELRAFARAGVADIGDPAEVLAYCDRVELQDAAWIARAKAKLRIALAELERAERRNAPIDYAG